MRIRPVAPLLALAVLLTPTLAAMEPASGVTCTIKGTAGKDKIRGTTKADVICGLGGDDQIQGGAGNDIILGGGGDDFIFGDGGADRLEGNDGDDEIFGRTGNDTLIGGDGNDALVDEDGTDTASGGPGNDIFGAGPGTDTYNAGGGIDEIRYLDRPAVKVSLDGVPNDGVAGENDTLIGFENLWGSGHGDVLIGDDGPNKITGNDGNDKIQGLGGNDRIIAGGGEDRADGGDGDDVLSGGSYPDVLIGGPGADTLNGQTAGYYQDACDKDLADTVTGCFQDDTTSTATLSFELVGQNANEVHPGESFTVRVSTADEGGTARVDLRLSKSSDQTSLPWCPAKATIESDPQAPEGFFDAVCSVPAGATVPDDVLVEVQLTDQVGNVAVFGADGTDPQHLSVLAAP